LSLSRLDDKPPFSFPSILADVFQAQKMIPIERWLFGQYNRLLPAKVSIRVLAVISMEGKDSLALGAVAPKIAEVASVLGDYLRLLDRRFANHRDDAIATAFPDGGVEGQKGRVRYQNHFVGHTVKGEQGGMLVGLKLAVIQVHKNKPYILPTIAGWDFARLANPIFDSPIGQNPPRLGREEVSFLLQHIKENVPVELFAYRVILSLVSQGENTPELVNQHLVRYITPGKNPQNEQDFISTQRNGVLGRMTDLGLVNRERQGTRITYQLTPEGKKFLNEIVPSQ
jgi:DNA-binding transcriptional ArsR family regulator